MHWTKKDLLCLYDLSAEEIEFILDTAAEFKKSPSAGSRKCPPCAAKRS